MSGKAPSGVLQNANPTVLVVDDDGEMADMLVEHLEAAGYRALAAAGGKPALAALKTHAIAAVITDLRMQEVDGLDVLAAAHASDPALPVIVMSAYGSMDEAVRRGAFQALAKPFKLNELTLLLERALAGRARGRRWNGP
jgi:two-component system response regulator HydG